MTNYINNLWYLRIWRSDAGCSVDKIKIFNLYLQPTYIESKESRNSSAFTIILFDTFAHITHICHFSNISQCRFLCSLPNAHKFLFNGMVRFVISKQWQVIQIARPDLSAEIDCCLFIMEISFSCQLPHQQNGFVVKQWYLWCLLNSSLFDIFITMCMHLNSRNLFTRSPRKMIIWTIEAFISISVIWHKRFHILFETFSNIILFSNNNKIEKEKRILKLKSSVGSEAAGMA